MTLFNLPNYRHRDIPTDGKYDGVFVNQLSDNVLSISRYTEGATLRVHITRRQALDLADALYFVCRPEDDTDPTEVPF